MSAAWWPMLSASHRKRSTVHHEDGEAVVVVLTGQIDAVAQTLEEGLAARQVGQRVVPAFLEQLLLTQSEVRGIGERARHPHWTTALVALRHPTRDHPAPGSVAASQSMFVLVEGLAPVQVRVEVGSQTVEVFGMHPREPLVDLVGQVVHAVAQQLTPAPREVHLAALHDPLPDPVVGSPHRKGKALLDLVHRPAHPAALQRVEDGALQVRTRQLRAPQVSRRPLLQQLRPPDPAGGLPPAHRVVDEHQRDRRHASVTDEAKPRLPVPRRTEQDAVEVGDRQRRDRQHLVRGVLQRVAGVGDVGEHRRNRIEDRHPLGDDEHALGRRRLRGRRTRSARRRQRHRRDCLLRIATAHAGSAFAGIGTGDISSHP